jgi:hypothetical protein
VLWMECLDCRTSDRTDEGSHSFEMMFEKATNPLPSHISDGRGSEMMKYHLH